MSQFFISYAREDRESAAQLADLLAARGYEVWWDHRLLPGHDYRQMIAEQIDEASKVIVLWSRQSVKSSFVADEAQRAMEAGKLIPIRIDDSAIPLGFGHLHTISLSELRKDFDCLEEAIGEAERIPDSRRPNPGGGRKFRWLPAFLIAAALVLVTWLAWDSVAERVSLMGLDQELDYTYFRSKPLGVKFAYPRALLMVDTTREREGVLPLHNAMREVEVRVRKMDLPEHGDVKKGRDEEQGLLESQGYSFNYIGPRDEANWSNWYVLSGVAPNRNEVYFKRWYADEHVISIEFDYPPEKIPDYNRIIPDMTLDRFTFD